MVKIPFKTFYKDSLTTSDSTKIFNITLVSVGMKKPDFSQRNGEGISFGGGGMGGGRGGMHGGGHGGSYGGGHGGGGYHNNGENRGTEDRSDLFETNKILINMKLAVDKR